MNTKKAPFLTIPALKSAKNSVKVGTLAKPTI